MRALTVQRWRSLWILKNMAGYEPIQMRKQVMNLRVVMEALAGKVFSILYQESPNTHLKATSRNSELWYTVTPIQRIATTARVKTGNKDPYMPNETRWSVGKPMWYTEDWREFATVAKAEIKDPRKQARMACHQFNLRLSSDAAVAHEPEVKLYEYHTEK